MQSVDTTLVVGLNDAGPFSVWRMLRRLTVLCLPPPLPESKDCSQCAFPPPSLVFACD